MNPVIRCPYGVAAPHVSPGDTIVPPSKHYPGTTERQPSRG
jgi:hypothetical protein